MQVAVVGLATRDCGEERASYVRPSMYDGIREDGVGLARIEVARNDLALRYNRTCDTTLGGPIY